jgi:hypothetical protein
MDSQGIILGRTAWRVTALRRAGAAFVCLALLYLAGGGSFLHQHKAGPETVCHVCQSLHAPALTASLSGIASAPQISAWLVSRSVFTPALDEFSVLRSGRAPPSA